MSRLRPPTLLIVLLALALLAGGCTAAQPAAQAPAEPAAAEAGAPAAAAGSDLVRIGWGGSPDTLNPGTAVLSEAFTIFELVYDALYELNLDGSYSLELAESVDVSDDGTVYTYTLRPGFTFHDGEPVTSQDVVFSFNFYQANEDFPFINVYTQYVANVEAPDDRTVVVTLSEAIPNVESQFVFLYILPEHIWGPVAETEATTFENAEMIGSGPFKLVEYEQNQFVRLEANPDHPLYPPKVSGAVFQTFDNPDALVQALRTGQVDMITEMPNTAVPTLRNAENITLVTGPPAAPEITDIIFNQVSEENCPPEDGVCSGHPALRDRTVRQALAHATNKQEIIDVVLLGLGAPGRTLVADSLKPFYDEELEDFAFDIAEANRLLDEAGYLDGDGDGVRETPDGQPLHFRMNWPSDSAGAPRMAELLGATWSQIGVSLEPQALDPDALTSICCPTFDFDVILWGWGSDPDPAFLLSTMLTSEISTGLSETGYSNPEYDDLFAQQATTLDVDERVAIIHRMQEIVMQDVVYIIPYYAQAVQAYRTDRFQGWITDAGKVALDAPSSLTVIEPVQ